MSRLKSWCHEVAANHKIGSNEVNNSRRPREDSFLVREWRLPKRASHSNKQINIAFGASMRRSRYPRKRLYSIHTITHAHASKRSTAPDDMVFNKIPTQVGWVGLGCLWTAVVEYFVVRQVLSCCCHAWNLNTAGRAEGSCCSVGGVPTKTPLFWGQPPPAHHPSIYPPQHMSSPTGLYCIIP